MTSASTLIAPITIEYGDNLTCYYEYFSQEVYNIKYEFIDLNLSNIVQTKGSFRIIHFLETLYNIYH